MTPVVSVVIASEFDAPLKELVASLDQQSLDTSDFEVVLVDLGASADTVERLRQLSRYRPNYTVVERSAAGELGAWWEHGTGEFVLRLRPDQRLLPQALERLRAEAEQHQLDVVSARVSARGDALPDLYTADRVLVDPELVTLALRGDAVLVRRSVLTAAGDPADPTSYQPGRTGVLASYPALVQPSHAAAGPQAGAEAPSCRWVEHLLRVEVGGTVPAPAGRSAGVDARAVVSVHHLATGLSRLLEPSEVTWDRPEPTDGAPGSWRWRVVVELDVAGVAGGTPLEQGLWELDVQLDGLGDEAAAPLTVAWASCPPAVIGQTMVVPSPVPSTTWQLDVGPTSWPLVGAVDPAQATVTESVQGSLLDVALPHLHLVGAQTIQGQLALDQLSLPAEIVVEGSGAHLRSFVSGWVGTPRLSTQFGAAPMRPTGAALAISGTGAMTVVEAKPPAARPAATKPAAKKTAAKKAAAGKPPAAKKTAAKPPTAKKTAAAKPAATAPVSPVQRLRRSVPRPLEPVVARLARHPLARRLYRRANGA